MSTPNIICMMVERGASIVLQGQQSISLIRDHVELKRAKNIVDAFFRRRSRVVRQIEGFGYEFLLEGRSFLFQSSPTQTVAFIRSNNNKDTEWFKVILKDR